MFCGSMLVSCEAQYWFVLFFERILSGFPYFTNLTAGSVPVLGPHPSGRSHNQVFWSFLNSLKSKCCDAKASHQKFCYDEQA